ncbi:uncharacterized protein OCT59_001607 [Rhizophagus irregularis]|uniref:uncharacterized protein n=1 Tax=Rhizophagus irregularis TaxID=588596 RepID=UPI003325D63C|nr:hypothetical protein OCT59_001607 [Rhizophagus irregularis]
MLLWEISSEQPPFANYNDDYRHAMDIVSEEQEAYHSKLYNFNIPEDIDDLNLNNDSASKTTSDFKGNSKALSKVFQKLRLGSGDNNQDNYGKEIVKQQIKETRYNEEDIFNNPNIDSKDQEIPDGNLI